MNLLIDQKDWAVLAIGLIPAIAISFYFYRKGLQKKQLAYALLVEDVLVRSENFPQELELSYRGRPIDVLTRATVYVWNAGNQPILDRDLDTSKPLAFSWPSDFEIFDVSVRFQSRETNNFAVDDSYRVHFTYLNAKDGAVIELTGTRGEAKRLPPSAWQTFGSLDGEIIGAQKGPVRLDYHVAGRHLYLVVILVGLALVGVYGGMGWSILGDAGGSPTYWDHYGWWTYLLIAGVGLIILLGTILTVAGIVAGLTGYKLPIKLGVMTHDPMTWRRTVRFFFTGS